MIDSPQHQPHLQPQSPQHPHDTGHQPSDHGAGLGVPAAAREAAVPMPHALARGAVRGLRAIALRRVQDRLAGIAPALLADAREDAEPDLETGLLAQLRAATTMHVRALHGRGESPERALVQAKHLLDGALRQEGWRDPVATDALRRRVVRWSIEAYYDR